MNKKDMSIRPRSPIRSEQVRPASVPIVKKTSQLHLCLKTDLKLIKKFSNYTYLQRFFYITLHFTSTLRSVCYIGCLIVIAHFIWYQTSSRPSSIGTGYIGSILTG